MTLTSPFLNPPATTSKREPMPGWLSAITHPQTPNLVKIIASAHQIAANNFHGTEFDVIVSAETKDIGVAIDAVKQTLASAAYESHPEFFRVSGYHARQAVKTAAELGNAVAEVNGQLDILKTRLVAGAVFHGVVAAALSTLALSVSDDHSFVTHWLAVISTSISALYVALYGYVTRPFRRNQ